MPRSRGRRLAELLDDYGNASAPGYLPELHAELLRNLARHVDASASRFFAEALVAKNADVRQAGLYAYTISRTGILPARAVELRKDTNPRVRSATLACLAARQHPQALEYAEAALTDFHLDVRLAAVHALGDLGGDKARTDLQRLLTHEPETIRAGAILALAAAGDDVTVFASANDPSWQVPPQHGAGIGLFPDAARRNDCPTIADGSQRRSAPRRDRFARGMVAGTGRPGLADGHGRGPLRNASMRPNNWPAAGPPPWNSRAMCRMIVGPSN